MSCPLESVELIDYGVFGVSVKREGDPDVAKVIERIEFSDDPNDAVEVTASGAVTGPDQEGGQHFGTTYLYVRLPGGPWRRPEVRSKAEIRRRTLKCESAAEAIELLCSTQEDRA